MTVAHTCLSPSALCKIRVRVSPGAKGECRVPRKLSLTLLILTALASSAPAGMAAPHGAKHLTSTTDDNAIYSAVLRYAYRSKVSGGGKHSEPASDATVMLQDSTVTICPTEEDRAVPYSHGLGEKDLEKCFAHPETELSPRVAAELERPSSRGVLPAVPLTWMVSKARLVRSMRATTWRSAIPAMQGMAMQSCTANITVVCCVEAPRFSF